ncbi:hypothetical protein FOZ62_019806, partial [Perkinsus olseni]
FMARGYSVPQAVENAIGYLHQLFIGMSSELYKVYACTNGKFSLELPRMVASAIAGGATCVQLRLKDVSTGDYIKLAKETKKAMPSHVPLIIDDRVDVCLASGADGVHVGDSDMPVKDA